MEKKDAFIQTDNNFKLNPNVGLKIDGNIDNILKTLKTHLEKIDVSDFMKHMDDIKNIDPIKHKDPFHMMRPMMNINYPNKNHIFHHGAGARCMVGGAGLGILSSIVGYIFMLTLIILVFACLLGYIFYLKHHNKCENKDCVFSLDSDFIEQIKFDIGKYLKMVLTCLLKKSVSIIKHISCIINVSINVYNKSVDELLLHLDSSSSSHCVYDDCCSI